MNLLSMSQRSILKRTDHIRVNSLLLTLFTTSAFAGKELGFKELGNRFYEIHFRQFFLGYADMNHLKIYDIMTYKDELKL